jgi:hypothetical protein
MSQGGSTRFARPKPKREDFIRKWLLTHDSFHVDGDGPDLRAAEKLVKGDPGLELVNEDTVAGKRMIPGWRLQRRLPC